MLYALEEGGNSAKGGKKGKGKNVDDDKVKAGKGGGKTCKGDTVGAKGKGNGKTKDNNDDIDDKKNDESLQSSKRERPASEARVISFTYPFTFSLEQVFHGRGHRVLQHRLQRKPVAHQRNHPQACCVFSQAVMD